MYFAAMSLFYLLFLQCFQTREFILLVIIKYIQRFHVIDPNRHWGVQKIV